LTAALAFGAATAAQSGQSKITWPQWGGPSRNFITSDPGLLLEWPVAGPTRRWQRPLGDGLSSIVTDGTTLYTLYRVGDDDVAVAIDAETGKTVWESKYAAPFHETCSNKMGPTPRATPLIAGDQVITISAGGLMNAFARATGTRVWARSVSEPSSPVRPCGSSSSPLAHGGLIITPGAQRGMVALDAKTGQTVWHMKEFDVSYSSPILVNVGGSMEVITLTGTDVVGLNPDTGVVEWTHPHPAEVGANVTTPVWGSDGLLFLSSSYDGGSRVLRLQRRDAKVNVEELWHHQRVRVHFGNAVRMGDRVFASSGDTGSAPLVALDALSGETVWRSRAVGRAMVIGAGKQLILLDEDGNLAIGTPAEAGLTVHAKAQVMEGVSWTPPTLSGTTLFIRNRQTIAALELGPPSPGARKH
jgi:outer membrane protein assembly factor BamB